MLQEKPNTRTFLNFRCNGNDTTTTGSIQMSNVHWIYSAFS